MNKIAQRYALPKPRELRAVVDKMMAHVPRNWEKRDELQLCLDNIVRAQAYKAPEILYESWNEAAFTLEVFLGDPNQDDWRTKVARIFGGLE